MDKQQKECEITAIMEKIKGYEKTLARCGDAYLTSVLRADINSLQKKLKNIREK